MTKGSRLPEDWYPTAAQKFWASQRRPELDIDEQAELFVNFWCSKTGKDATKLSWDRTWRNWIIRSYGPIHKREVRHKTVETTQRERQAVRREPSAGIPQPLQDIFASLRIGVKP